MSERPIIKLGLMRDNYQAHSKYAEYVSKMGGKAFPDLVDDYECFVEWMTRPAQGITAGQPAEEVDDDGTD